MRQFTDETGWTDIYRHYFDPAYCTLVGLFDAFRFVMRRIDDNQNGRELRHTKNLQNGWIAISRITSWNFQALNNNWFYRGGVTGVNILALFANSGYQFYIRSLNPANIEQGMDARKQSLLPNTKVNL